jgi:hypothetical protein
MAWQELRSDKEVRDEKAAGQAIREKELTQIIDSMKEALRESTQLNEAARDEVVYLRGRVNLLEQHIGTVHEFTHMHACHVCMCANAYIAYT